MCHVIGEAVELAEKQTKEAAAEQGGLSRRSLLKRSGAAAAAAGIASVGAPGTALGFGAGRGGRGEYGRLERKLSRQASDYRTRLVLLGTVGGPTWTMKSDRFGISSALSVAGNVYLVDFGEGTFYQYRRAGLATASPDDKQLITTLRAAFLTHLHSDHTVDYNNLIQWGLANGRQVPGLPPIQIYGPGNRGELEPLQGPAPEPPVVNPENPTPGTVEMTNYLIQAYATDFNDRMRDNRLSDPRNDYEVHDIVVPAGLVSDPNVDPSPPTDPFPVYEDEWVKVTATLVHHGPVFPAFGFRFDTDDGSVVFSGDTSVSQNLITLARDADILVHEAIDPRWVESMFPDPTAPAAQPIIQHLLGAHTLIEQVGGVAEQAGAKTLVLTHLVPPYTPRKRWLEAGNGYSGRLLVGEDLMQVGVGLPQRGGRGKWEAQARE